MVFPQWAFAFISFGIRPAPSLKVNYNFSANIGYAKTVYFEYPQNRSRLIFKKPFGFSAEGFQIKHETG
jgi:hypothetical protein